MRTQAVGLLGFSPKTEMYHGEALWWHSPSFTTSGVQAPLGEAPPVGTE